MYIYENNFKGAENEMRRLRRYANSKIILLKKKAPNFYENKLPVVINQAASALLSCDVSTQAGTIRFNETHKHFLLVLDALAENQPSGDVDFQREKDRIMEFESLKKECKDLNRTISILESTEVDYEDLGDEEGDTEYMKTLVELQKNKDRLNTVCRLIAAMAGEQVEEEAEFKLVVPPRSLLARLEQSQLESLEEQIREFDKSHKKKKELFVDRSTIDGILAKLNIDPTKFTKDELTEFSKEALEAYRSFYRDIDNARRNEYYDGLLKNSFLKPKEGAIISDPDDVPEEVLRKLEDSDREKKRKLEQFIEEFAKRPCPENEDQGDIAVEQDGEESEDEAAGVNQEIAKNSYFFGRVKEEPRDDYVASDAEDDLVEEDPVEESPLEDYPLEDDADPVEDDARDEMGDDAMIVDPPQTAVDESDEREPQLESPETNTSPSDVKSEKSAINQDDNGEEFEMLGVVAPVDKIPEVIELD